MGRWVGGWVGRGDHLQPSSHAGKVGRWVGGWVGHSLPCSHPTIPDRSIILSHPPTHSQSTVLSHPPTHPPTNLSIGVDAAGEAKVANLEVAVRIDEEVGGLGGWGGWVGGWVGRKVGEL